jgi:hypothetical protein
MLCQAIHLLYHVDKALNWPRVNFGKLVLPQVSSVLRSLKSRSFHNALKANFTLDGFVFHRDGDWISEIIDDKLYLIKPE